MMGFKTFRSTPAPGRVSDHSNDEDEFHDAIEAHLHPNATADGGITCHDQTLIQSQRRIVIDIAKQLGMKLLSGSLNLINITLPVIMFEPRSYLQKLADPWVYPDYLSRAAAAQDPLERLKLLTTWFIAGAQHIFASWRKPFNPILGETWQAQLHDGTQIFMEQILHHPPVTAFTMVGPGGAYTFEGLSQPDVSYKGSSIKTSAKGYRRMVFSGGQVVTLKYPYYQIDKIMYPGEPTAQLKGVAEFVDVTNHLVSEVHFGPIVGAQNPLLKRQDTISVQIYRKDLRHCNSSESFTIAASVMGGGDFSHTPVHHAASFTARSSKGGGGLWGGRKSTAPPALDKSSHVVLCRGEGSWLSHLNLDGERYWTLAEANPATWEPVEDPLPSDCRFREDLAALRDGLQDESQELKKVLEDRQRNDAKRRPKYAHVGCS